MQQLFTRIEDATGLNVGDLPVVTPELFFAWQANMIKSRNIARIWKSEVKAKAHINHGRWLINCPACTLDVFTEPHWKLALCGECGAVYDKVEFPEDYKAIEKVLCIRPRHLQNWFPGETVRDLMYENFAHASELGAH